MKKMMMGVMMMNDDDGGGGDDDILKREDRLVIKQKLSNRATGSLQKSLCLFGVQTLLQIPTREI